MTDAKAKRILAWTLVLSSAVGLLVGGLTYCSIVDARSWNVAGLIVILAVAAVSGVIALGAFLQSRRARY
jgi:hypothetical protein